MCAPKGFCEEQAAGKALWIGFLGNPQDSTRAGWGAHGHVKDGSSTDVLVHDGELLTTFWQCGEGYRLSATDLQTLGTQPWVPSNGISAHPKKDLSTGELLFFNYATSAPFMQYGVVGADNRLKHCTDIALPGARLPHDMAFSQRYSVLSDFPLFWEPDLLQQDVYFPVYDAKLRSRFGVLPRYGSGTEVQWFEADPTYVLHFTNCYEEGDELVLDGYFQDNPYPAPLKSMPEPYQAITANLDLHSLKTHLHRWRFNLKTGTTREERLCDSEFVEFGTINPNYMMRKNRFVYSALGEPGWFLFRGLVKHDLQTGRRNVFEFGDRCFGSEAPFVPRRGSTEEDDGYLVSFVTDMVADQSECLVLDAQAIERGPVCRIILPQRICSGTHAVWADASELQA